MSTLHFDRQGNTLTLVAGNGAEIGTWDAANIVDTHSQGTWPGGQYGFSYCNTHPDDAPDSAYGIDGIIIFDVPGRTGMGVHSGRENVPDGAGRKGFRHCTMGCVRTTDAAMAQLVATHQADPITAVDIS
jgi:hypothetical protein